MNADFTEEYSSLFDTEYTTGRLVYFNDPNTFFRGIFALLLRAGFILIQLGCVPVENIYIIILQNIVDIAVATISYAFLGFSISYGKETYYGLFGYNAWMGDPTVSLDDSIFGLSACLISTALITTFLSGRITFVSVMLISFVQSALFQSVIIHWTWHSHGIMNKSKLFNKRVNFKDTAGSMVIHVTASVVGLIGALFLGRRVMRMQDVDQFSIRSESSGTTITGYFFVIIGLIAFSLPGPNLKSINCTSLILVNNLMAISGGIITATILNLGVHRNIIKYWVTLRCLQGAVAGVVCIAAGIDVYSPLMAFSLAVLASTVFFIISYLVHESCLEDNCNVIAIHLCCGALGVLLPPFCGQDEHLGSTVQLHYQILHFMWQMTCLAVLVAILIVLYSFLWLLLFGLSLLRNHYELINHYRSVTLVNNLPPRFFGKRLYKITKNASYLTPSTNVNLGKTAEKNVGVESNKSMGVETKSLEDEKLAQKIFFFEVDNCVLNRSRHNVHCAGDSYQGTNSVKMTSSKHRFHFENLDVMSLEQFASNSNLSQGSTGIGSYKFAKQCNGFYSLPQGERILE